MVEEGGKGDLRRGVGRGLMGFDRGMVEMGRGDGVG